MEPARESLRTHQGLGLTAILVLAGRLILSTVFAIAGTVKLADQAGTRRTLVAFGLSETLTPLVALLLPLSELAVTALLLPATTAAAGAVVALALLLVFCAAIAVAMAHGRAPDCHCFGQLRSAPAGWSTLVRNAVLASLAAFVIVAGRDDRGPGGFAWVSSLDGIERLVLGLAVVIAIVMAVGGYAVVHVLRSYGRVLVRLEAVEERLRAAGFELEEPDDVQQLGLAPGTPAPAFWLPSTHGDRVALGDLLEPGRPVLLLFTSPTCGPCSLLMPEVARWQREHGDELTVALLSDGDPELIRAEAAEHGLLHVLVDEKLSAYEAYEANGTPSAVLVAGDGTIASWLAAGGDWIETLVEQALAGADRRSGLPVGASLPDLRLERLDGGKIALADAVERETVLLFWNPGCGFCRAMHDDLKAWEQHRPEGAPELLVVSAGSAEEVRAEAFTSIVLLDPEWTAAAALGVDGTPMAILVDGEGKVASSPVTGAADALSFLRLSQPALSEA